MSKEGGIAGLDERLKTAIYGALEVIGDKSSELIKNTLEQHGNVFEGRLLASISSATVRRPARVEFPAREGDAIDTPDDPYSVHVGTADPIAIATEFGTPNDAQPENSGPLDTEGVSMVERITKWAQLVLGLDPYNHDDKWHIHLIIKHIMEHGTIAHPFFLQHREAIREIAKAAFLEAVQVALGGLTKRTIVMKFEVSSGIQGRRS